MTINKHNANTQLRASPFGQNAGYSTYKSLMDQAGRTNNIGGFGDLQVANRVTSISMAFQYGLLADLVTVDQVGGGAHSIVNSMLKISGSAAGDKYTVTTRSAIIYSSGFDGQAMFTAAFTKYQNAVIHQDIGPHDNQDGYSIGVKEDQLVIRRFKNGVIVDEVLQSDFSLDKVDGSTGSSFNLDPEKLNLYRIQYGYLGLLPAIFEVYGGLQHGWVPMHIIEIINTDVNMIIENPHLPIQTTVDIQSGDPGKEVAIYSGSWYGGVLGGLKQHEHVQHFGDKAEKTISAGVETPLLALRSATTFNGITNRLRMDLEYFSADADGTKSVEFAVYANPTITTGTWNDVEAGLSYAQTNTTLTSWAGGRYLGSLYLGKVANDVIQMDPGAVRFNPGDSMLVTAKSVNQSDTKLSLRWGEGR